MSIEEAYQNCEKMIYSLCWKFSSTYPVRFDDCLSLAHESFVEAFSSYNPKKGAKFSTWCHFSIWCKLKNSVIRGSKEPLDFREIHDYEIVTELDPSYQFDILGELSADAKEIIELILEFPNGVLGSAPATPFQLLNKVRHHLINLGRKRSTIDTACAEIRAALAVASSA